MKHVLITKFAMRFAENNPRRRYERPDWVDYRMNLLKKFCIPSVQSQTVKNFDWWFVVNEDFPGLTTSHLRELEKFGRVVFVDAPWEEEQPEIGQVLSPYYQNQWVCSTRLDSDDILARRFFENLVQEVKEQEEWISFRYGYIIEGREAALRDYAVNPFLSYVEYAAPMKSVFHVSHTKANRDRTPFRIIPKTLWAQIDHGDNIKNHARYKVRNFDNIKIDVSDLQSVYAYTLPEE